MRSVVRSRRSLAAAAIVLLVTIPLCAEVISEFARGGDLDERNEIVLREIDTIDASLPLLWQGEVAGGSLAVRGQVSTVVDADGYKTYQTRIALALTRGGSVRSYEIPIADWVSTACHDEPDTTITATPFGSERATAGVLLSFHQIECGMHSSSDTETVLLIDASAKPRAVSLPFSESELWGYGNAGVFSRTDTTRCLWNGRDFECSQTRTTETAWGKPVSARRFTAFAGESLPIISAHVPRVRSIEELTRGPRPTDRPILVDHLGLLWPVERVSPSAHLYASIDHDDLVHATFYLIGDRGATALLPPDILDVAEGPETVSRPISAASSGLPFTRVSDSATFRASRLRTRGSEHLDRVVLQIGEERSLYWIAIDSAKTDRFAAVRMASTAAEGEDETRPVPASLMSYRFKNSVEAVVKVANGWFHAVIGGPTCCLQQDAEESTPTAFDGVVRWSPSGFVATLTPLEDGGERVFVTIGADGKLGTKPLASIYEDQ